MLPQKAGNGQPLRSIRCVDVPSSTPRANRDRQAYRPVRMPYRVGVQTADPE